MENKELNQLKKWTEEIETKVSNEDKNWFAESSYFKLIPNFKENLTKEELASVNYEFKEYVNNKKHIIIDDYIKEGKEVEQLIIDKKNIDIWPSDLKIRIYNKKTLILKHNYEIAQILDEVTKLNEPYRTYIPTKEKEEKTEKMVKLRLKIKTQEKELEKYWQTVQVICEITWLWKNYWDFQEYKKENQNTVIDKLQMEIKELNAEIKQLKKLNEEKNLLLFNNK